MRHVTSVHHGGGGKGFKVMGQGAGNFPHHRTPSLQVGQTPVVHLHSMSARDATTFRFATTAPRETTQLMQTSVPMIPPALCLGSAQALPAAKVILLSGARCEKKFFCCRFFL